METNTMQAGEELEIEVSPSAIEGVPEVTPFEGRPARKVGVEEFMELADSWGFSEETKIAIQAQIEKDEFPAPLLSRYYNPRPSKVDALEKLVGQLLNVPYVLGVNSGSSALNTAYIAAGLGPGAEVIVPAYTFFATVAEIVTARAIPVIAEINESLTIDPEDIERKITPRTKAIAPVHMIGTNCDMDAIMDIARRHNLLVIEDTAQACGGSYKGKKLGTIGDFGCFSLSSYKIVGGGEAGLVTTKDPFLYTRAQNNHDTGACWRPDRFGPEEQEGELFCGYNFKMSELEGAVNLAQFRKMEARVSGWQRNKKRIVSQLQHFNGVTPQRVNDPDGEVGYNLVFFAPDGESAGRAAEAINAQNIFATARGGKTSRDWHIYSYWEHIMKMKSSSPDGCPWTCEKNANTLPKYAPDMCPRTNELMNRVVFLNLENWWTQSDCDQVASRINGVLRPLFGRSGDQVGW